MKFKTTISHYLCSFIRFVDFFLVQHSSHSFWYPFSWKPCRLAFAWIVFCVRVLIFKSVFSLHHGHGYELNERFLMALSRVLKPKHVRTSVEKIAHVGDIVHLVNERYLHSVEVRALEFVENLCANVRKYLNVTWNSIVFFRVCGIFFRM